MPTPSSPLSGLLTSDTIAARVSAGAWQEAIARVGELMTRAGICEAHYADAMTQAVTELGPYIVIAPGVAMPHARPEHGVIRPGIALLTLDQPVEFGSTVNDPVDVVIAFAALDKEAHLATLQSIAAFVGDQEALSRVRSAATTAELAAAVNLEER